MTPEQFFILFIVFTIGFWTGAIWGVNHFTNRLKNGFKRIQEGGLK